MLGTDEIKALLQFLKYKRYKGLVELKRDMTSSAAQEIRVLVVDDHTIVREGIRALLSPHSELSVVGEASDGNEALGKVRNLRPDVVLMDLTMPNMDGLTAIQRVKEASPNTRVLALTVHDDEQYFCSALAAGASGYLLKGSFFSDLVSAIRTVHQGKTYVDPSIAGKLVNICFGGTRDADRRQALNRLSDREECVLRLIGAGLTNQEIAENLRLSINTVQSHRSRIKDKLKLHKRLELVNFAVQEGLVDTRQ